MQITGAQLLVKALKQERVSTLFGYPGGQVIDLFHALYSEKEIEVILPRHEQGLIHAADGYARSTGKTGVCLVTSGPGAANLVTGIATANYDSVPLVCFTGQVPAYLLGKESFQEADITAMVKGISKYAVMVRRREDLADTIKKAFYAARSGRPGVAVVDLPKDIQTAYGSDFYETSDLSKEKTVSQSDEKDLLSQTNKVMDVLNHAKKPLFLAGGGVHSAHACKEMTLLARLTGVPVVTTIMGKGAVPASERLYVGNIGIHGSYAANSAVSQCDVLCAVGTRFNDRITGGIEKFAPNAVIIHIDIDGASISRNVTADIPVISDAKRAICAMLKRAEPLKISEWTDKICHWKEQYPVDMGNKGLTPQKIIHAVNDVFKDAIVAADVGQNQLWTTQFLDVDEHKRLLTSGGFGTMGYGLPAAIGAKLGSPWRDVIVITGDGGMQMNIQEMATAVVYELPVIICILNVKAAGEDAAGRDSAVRSIRPILSDWQKAMAQEECV